MDIYVRINELPSHDEAVEAQEVYLGGGGSASNFAVALSRLGIKSRILGYVGNDMIGDIVLNELRAEGVDVGLVRRAGGGATGFVIVILGPGGVKRMIAHRGANLSLGVNDIDEASLAGSSHIHVALGRLDIIRRVSEVCKRLGMTLSLDGGSSLARQGLTEILDSIVNIDVWFMNRAEAQRLTGLVDVRSAAEKLYGRAGVNELVITMGEEGSLLMTRGELFHEDAFDVEPIDTTGAGDTFAAAYITAKLLGLEPRYRLVFANAAAALKVTRRGARSSPSMKEVLGFLAERGRDDVVRRITEAMLSDHGGLHPR